MSTLQIIGIVCLLYCAVTLYIVAARPKVWNIPKIQAFVNILGETGARVFIGAWGLVMGALGAWMVGWFG